MSSRTSDLGRAVAIAVASLAAALGSRAVERPFERTEAREDCLHYESLCRVWRDPEFDAALLPDSLRPGQRAIFRQVLCS